MENNSNQKLFTPLVFVRCLTFNHEAYIEDALNGFVIQQTNFPFIVTIVNDASPDNTKNVIKTFIKKICDSSSIQYEQTSYADIIKATPNNNSNCFLYVLNLYENHFQKKSHRPYYQEYVDKAKYWAECEGDDYWTDPLKLQKQVDFLEANPEYVICCHRYKIYNQNDGTWDKDYIHQLFDKSPNGFSFSNKENFENWATKTLTLLIRQDALRKMPAHKGFKYWRDVHMNYYLLKQGKGFCMPFVGGVCTRHNGGVFSSIGAMNQWRINLKVWNELLCQNREDEVLFAFYQKQHNAYRDYIVSNIFHQRNNEMFLDIKILFMLDLKYNGMKSVILSIKQMILALKSLTKKKIKKCINHFFQY